MIQRDKPDTVRIALVATAATILVAFAATVATLLALRLRSPTSPEEISADGTGAQAPTQPAVQPAIEAEMPAHVPTHFTEEVVLPGITKTGVDIEQEDAVEGRSPEGV
jgi:hypothetical protein